MTFFTFIDWRDPVALGWWWTFMCWPTIPNITVNIFKWPSLSLTLKTDSLSLSFSHIHNLKHIIESCSWCDSAAKSNLYAAGLARSDETSCYFTEGGRKSHSHICLGEWALRVSVCVCVRSHYGQVFCVLTAWALPNAAVLSVPVPQQQGGISGAWQNVAVSSDVRLRASQTCHHVTMPKHYLSQFACKSK